MAPRESRPSNPTDNSDALDEVEAAELNGHGLVKVNGQIEDRRGRQLAAGDVVEVGGRSVRLVPRG